MGETQLRTERRGEPRPEPEVPRPLWSVRMVALVVGIPLLVVFAIVVANLLDRREISTSTVAGPIDRVVIQVARGDVALVPAPPGTVDVVVETTLRWRIMRPESVVETGRSGVVNVSGSCPRVVVVLGTCSVDHVVQVPADTAVLVRTGEGSVEATGLDATVRILVDGGSVAATELRSQRVIVEASGGAVDLAFAGSPSDLDVSSAGGDVRVTVTDDLPFDVRVAGTSGEVDLDVEVDVTAERRMRIDAGTGRVTVTRS